MFFYSSFIKYRKLFQGKKSFLKRPFRFYFRLHIRSVLISFSALVVTNILFSLPPRLIGQIIDKINEKVVLGEVSKILFLFLIVLIFLFTSRFIWRILWGGFRHRVAENLQKRIFKTWTHLGPRFFSKHSTGQLVSLINNDVSSFSMAIGPGSFIVCDVILLLCFIGSFMLSISIAWTWKCLLFMPIVPCLIYFLSHLIQKRYKIQQERFAKMAGVSEEILSGIRVIKSYNQQDHQTHYFNQYSEDYKKACTNVEKIEAFFNPITSIGVASGGFLLLIFAAPDVVSGSHSLGDFFAFHQYIQQLSWPLVGMGIGGSLLKRGRASFERMLSLFETPIEVPDRGKEKISTFKNLSVKNLSFTHEGESTTLLKNITFNLKAGESLGLIGLTGSGKTTLVGLLCHLYPIEKNKIFFNNQCITKISLKSLRNLITYVPQESFLFSDTLFNNLSIVSNESQTESLKRIETFYQLLELKNEVQGFLNKSFTILGEKGVNLSGGQKQRISIIRALMRKTDILILDDNLRATDVNTSSKILLQLKKLFQEEKKTLILMSQRLIDFKNMDKLLVLKNGEQESFGLYDDVRKTSPTYKRLFQLQKSKQKNQKDHQENNQEMNQEES